jgi:hypothetical protein
MMLLGCENLTRMSERLVLRDIAKLSTNLKGGEQCSHVGRFKRRQESIMEVLK